MEAPSESNSKVCAAVQSFFGHDYDVTVRRLCPDYDEMLAHVVRALPAEIESLVDLGCGTGTLLEMIVRARPSLRRVIGVDRSAAFLARTSGRIPPGGAFEIDLREADILSFGFPNADAYVSSLTLHEFDPLRQVEIASRIAEATPLFVHFDVVAGGDERAEAERWAYLDWWLERDVPDRARRDELFAMLRGEGRPMTLANHREVCRAVGLEFCEIVRSPTSVTYAAVRKPGG